MGCEKCKKSGEVEIKTRPYTDEEFHNIIPLLDKYNITPQERDYIYNFYNRVFGTNKVPGCGKCFVNICKNLKKKYSSLY